jgi:hypothetical protein
MTTLRRTASVAGRKRLGESNVPLRHFRFWHFSEVPGQPDHVRYRGKTGSDLPTAK